MHQVPPSHIATAFGARGTPRRLPGGRGTSHRVGEVVLKPVENEFEARWVADVYAGIGSREGFRVPEPIEVPRRGYVVEGWSAWRFLDGTTVSGERYRERLEVSAAFHRAVSRLVRPAFLDLRMDPWSRADRIVWDGAVWSPHPRIEEAVERLRWMVRPLALPLQVIHGDITGNVLFADGELPAVIDFVPYWRPAAYADAILVSDVMIWEGAPARVAESLAERPSFHQLMVRATLWRLLVADVSRHVHRLPDASLDQVERYLGFITWLEKRAATPES